MRDEGGVCSVVGDLRAVLVDRLRAAGCVFAEEEADILLEQSDGPDDLEMLCRRRVAGEPLEHIVGWVDFGRLRLAVGPGVFVPRQRSKLISRLAIGALRSSASSVFVEAYAGVGPLAASVLREIPRTAVHAADIDETAVAFAGRNLGAAGLVHHGSGLSALPGRLRGRVDVIAAVPPYAPTTASDLLSHEAREHEPPTALFGGSDGLDHVRRLSDEALEWLAPEGRVLIEMNKHQCAAAVRYAKRADYTVILRTGEDGQTAVIILRRARPARRG